MVLQFSVGKVERLDENFIKYYTVGSVTSVLFPPLPGPGDLTKNARNVRTEGRVKSVSQSVSAL